MKNVERIADARVLQEKLRTQVITEDRIGKLEHIGGCDVSSKRFSRIVHAAIACLQKADWKKTASATATAQANFPYIPGYLSFREIPCILDAWQELTHKPDLLFVDGQGVSHPRGLGIASHLGVILDIPTIGVGKSILVGKPAGVLGSCPGDTTGLIFQGKTVGVILRSKARCNPLIISIGHKISLQTALNLVLDSLHGYRLPEPTRHAHIVANQERLSYGSA